MIYFDACYIAKFYLAEPDSPSVIVFAKGKAKVGCLLIGKAEVIAVFHRKLREGVVDVSGFHLLCDQFEADCASGLWQWRAVDDALLASSTRRFRGLPSTTFLRAADGLHLTCAAETGVGALERLGLEHMGALGLHGFVDEQAEALGKAVGTFVIEELQHGLEELRMIEAGHVWFWFGVFETPQPESMWPALCQTMKAATPPRERLRFGSLRSPSLRRSRGGVGLSEGRAFYRKTFTPPIGRKDEILRVARILSQKRKANPVLVGEPGVGKTGIVEGLAQRIASSERPEFLRDARSVEISLAAPIAGARQPCRGGRVES